MILRHSGWNPNVLPPLDLNEQDIDKIAGEFEEFHQLFQDAFYRVEQTGLSQCYLQGLMSPLKRKSMEPIAINLMDTHRVRSLQHFVTSGKWDLDLLVQRHKEQTAKTVADCQGREHYRFVNEVIAFIEASSPFYTFRKPYHRFHYISHIEFQAFRFPFP